MPTAPAASQAAAPSSPPRPERPFRSQRRTRLLLPALAAALLLTLVLAGALGPVETTPLQSAQILLGHLLPDMPWMSDGSLTPAQDQAVVDFRLPRAVLAALAGACLALAGALLQVAVRNPLAEPYLIGVSSGAGLGATAVIVLGSAAGITALTQKAGSAPGGLAWSNAAAFAGAVLAIALVYLVAQQKGMLLPTRLILVGVALGAMFSAVTNFLISTTDAQNVVGVLYFLLGSVSGAGYGSLWMPAVALAVALAVIAPRVRQLDALMVGDDVAASLGVRVPRLRLLLFLLTALLTASTVAVAGGIGFVGLVVPHVARLAVGSSHRAMLPVAALGGAVFLAASDLAARTVAEPREIPIGIITSLAGAPFFLYLLRREGGA
ncbi:FecCD family ABC transporter permease [Arthrobacter sp. UM1]|uniref:FecCD family ABC transporter permease n=1 Tax=Arthrobacter sp. UM1 TaxID=2766776 RepID=UPI001CF70CCD|nr:iron ABC transporter permease [Arthrobacter sp. UM1]MCB4209211.1 iron ABC transporter permease [Arthrobacter sp. UM1]